MPLPVPLGITAKDEDTLCLKCLREKSEVTVGGLFTVSWSFSPPQAFSTGAFVDGRGRLVPSIEDAHYVVYLPPRDLDCGEVREFKIQALVWDPCVDIPALVDVPVAAYFLVSVSREPAASGGSYFSVSIQEELPVDYPLVPEGLCRPNQTSSCCTLVWHEIKDLPGIVGGISDWPEHGMLTEELRPISVDALDKDTMEMECGEPPCPSTFASTVFCDSLTYTWEVLEGGGQFLFSTGRTGIYKAGNMPAAVTVKVTIKDAGGDDDLELFATFHVYRMHFIDQENNELATLPDEGTGNPASDSHALEISLEIPGRNMNGCPGGPSPTFEGPVPSTPDARTFRVQVEKKDAFPGAVFETRIRVRRAWPAAHYTSATPYETVFPMLAGPGAQSDILRSDRHLRLVSNGRPPAQGSLPPVPEWQWDDEVCGDQTILVAVGDWVEAALLVDGEVACFLELPVGRPWSEVDNPKSILTAFVNWTATTNAAYEPPPNTTHMSWDDAAAFVIQRGTEDWAQANIRFEPNNIQVKGPFFNSLSVPMATFAFSSGTLTITVTPSGGSPVIVMVPITSGEVPEQIAVRIANEMANSTGLDVNVYDHDIPGERQFLIVVDRGSNDMSFIIDTGGTQFPLTMALQDWTHQVLTHLEANLLGVNVKEVLGFGQSSIEVILVHKTHVFNQGWIAATGTTGGQYPDPNSFPGLAWTVFLSEVVGDGWDGSFPMTYGHELGHALLNLASTAHSPDTKNLMYESAIPFATGSEHPARKKRLTVSQISDAREFQQFLRTTCVPIPQHVEDAP